MSSAGKHLRNAERHHAAAVAAGEITITRAWAAVALFYSAHQLVHAVLDGQTTLQEEFRHPTSHATGQTSGVIGTSQFVARLFKEIDLQYKSLFGTGKAVRYEGRAVSQSEFADLLSADYGAVASWARQKLQDQGRASDLEWL